MKLYVGNLNFNTTEDSIAAHFGAHGNVDEVFMPLDRMSGRPRGFAFVTMNNDDEANAAKEALDGADLDGRPLKVNEAQERAPRGGGGGGGGGHRGGGGGGRRDGGW
jgi:RNA recognition motif-containing protein